MLKNRDDKCPHPSFALVLDLDEELKETFTLYCYSCGEALPFFFYSRDEYDELKKDDYKCKLGCGSSDPQHGHCPFVKEVVECKHDCKVCPDKQLCMCGEPRFTHFGSTWMMGTTHGPCKGFRPAIPSPEVFR